MKPYSRWIALAAMFFTGFARAETADLNAVHLIKQEAYFHSQVMDYIHLIADEHGSRMAGSPSYRSAADKAVATTTRNFMVGLVAYCCYCTK